MNINFEAFNEITCMPELPEGFHQGKLVDIKTSPATETRREIMALVFAIPYEGWTIQQIVRVYGYHSTILVAKDTPNEREFQPISQVIGPLRAQAKQPTAPLGDMLKWATENDVNLKLFRNDNNYPELRVAYPKPEEPAEEPVSDTVDTIQFDL